MAEPPEAPAIQPLDEHHDRADFTCGNPTLDDYLRRRARQDRDRRVAAVFVMVGEEPGTIAGYYTLSSLSIELRAVPPDIVRRLPRYPNVPAVLIGRLAIDQRYQGRGLGGLLLMDALHRVLEQSKEIAAWAAIVDAVDAPAAAFYGRYGFRPLVDRPNRLFLPIATIERMFA
ncbi:MAG: GNAT family N-acetyltransferase [Proteobacteria bacterium]|nr:GNAT family N-acetyltransferase [Pseudomonadota bacterium]